MAIITYPLNDVEYSAEDASTYLCTRTSGIYSSESMFNISIVSDRTISISEGIAWINNSQYEGKSIVVTTPTTLEVAPSNDQNRIDLVVLKFDAEQNASYFDIKEGSPSANPVAPTVTRNPQIYELGLYLITIPANSNAISSLNISSVKLNETYCGLMRDGVTRIPTQDLENEFRAVLNNLLASVGDFVPATRQVNGKSLANDITLTAEDVNALPTSSRGAANGVASLNENSQIPTQAIPDLSNTYLAKSGGTMAGVLKAQNNTSYTVKQVRNIFLVAEGESLPSGANGDICLVYKA